MMFFKNVALKQMQKKLNLISKNVDEVTTGENIETRKRNEGGGTFMIRTLLKKDAHGKSQNGIKNRSNNKEKLRMSYINPD